jgi:hypothetical protein
MSYVADTILVFSICEDEHARLADVNRVLAPCTCPSGQQFVGNVADFETKAGTSAYGGCKALQTPTFVAAFNYLDIEQFVEGLRTIAWEHPEEVQLLVSNENDEPSHYTQRYPDHYTCECGAKKRAVCCGNCERNE